MKTRRAAGSTDFNGVRNENIQLGEKQRRD